MIFEQWGFSEKPAITDVMRCACALFKRYKKVFVPRSIGFPRRQVNSYG